MKTVQLHQGLCVISHSQISVLEPMNRRRKKSRRSKELGTENVVSSRLELRLCSTRYVIYTANRQTYLIQYALIVRHGSDVVYSDVFWELLELASCSLC